jgi:PHD/YefM family antitoxin component YafN of YafNO toxin-antitoxin module
LAAVRKAYSGRRPKLNFSKERRKSPHSKTAIKKRERKEALYTSVFLPFIFIN